MRHTNVMSFEVGATQAATYRYFADLRNLPAYDPPVTWIEPSTSEGWDGDRFAVRFAPTGVPSFPVEVVVRRRQPDDSLHFVITGKAVTAEDRLEFVADGPATRVTIHATLELRGALAPAVLLFRLASPLLTRAMARHLARVATRACTIGATP